MAKKTSTKNDLSVKIIPLGGLGEVGKNSWIFAINDNWILIDSGLGFPFNEIPGVELIFPDIDYIIANKENIKALIITHAHEDHIGGAVRTLTQASIPMLIGPKLVNAIIEKKFEELGIETSTTFKAATPGEVITIGDFSIEFIRSTHSVPDCFALLIKTPAGNILHSGDFKFDFTPVDGEHFDIPRLVEAGKEGIKLLISDSTNVERDGFSLSEKTVGPNLLRIFEKTEKRIFITTFSSHIHRIQQILDAAEKTGRKVCIHGYSMELFSQIARDTGYLEYSDKLVVSIEKILKLPEEKVVIITSGSQGEPSSTLAKMVRNEHKTLQLTPGDTVIFSANPIPGNERAVSKLQDALCSLGADLIYGRSEKIHVSGHASQKELKLMMALTRPEHFLPAHGDYRMLVKHAELAASMEIPPENIYILENGDTLELTGEKISVHKNEIEAYPVYYDCIAGGVVDGKILKDRTMMGDEGLIVIMLAVNNTADELLSIEIDFKGVTFKDSTTPDQLTENIKESITQAFDRMKKFGTLDLTNLKTVCKDITLKSTENKLYCKPLILTITQNTK